MPPVGFPARIVAVWTRDLDAGDHVGRINTAREIRAALADVAPVTNRRLTNAFEDRLPVSSLFWSLVALFKGLLSGRPLPLQSALFAAAARRSALLEDVVDTDVVYLDGIRTLLWLRRLRKSASRSRVIVDLDDLMSRRYEHLSRCGLPFSLGYLERAIPRSILTLIRVERIARVVVWYERLALLHAEREVLELADSAVLVNRSEAALLRRMRSELRGTLRATVAAIPPMTKLKRHPPQSSAGRIAPEAWHAIFVGSDTLPQNRLTIAYLLDLWSASGIKTRLYVYGRQNRRWPDVPNVTFCGYIPDIADAYKPGCILVCPSLLPGGIKTKVLEALAYGAPVVGNALTFDGILPGGYPLVIEQEADLVALLQAPASYADKLMQAARIGSAYLAQEHSAALFAARWRQEVLGTADDRRAAPNSRLAGLDDLRNLAG